MLSAALLARSLTAEYEDVEMKNGLNLALAVGALCLSMLGGVLMIYGQSAAQLKLPQTKQLIFVTTPDWNAVSGTLQRYERANGSAPWRPVGASIPIVVGRNGLAWGRGLHGEPQTLARGNDPLKREGDGKAPAGAFKLTAAFGYAPPAQARRVKLPYLHAKEAVQCVDDAQSAYYNQVVDRAQIKTPDWQSHEEMRRKDELYRWGVVVEHNAGSVSNQRSQAQPRGGSCIFLHIWSGAGRGTAGCTAMEAKLMEEVLYWLDPQKQPVLVQLPEREFARLQEAWKLPAKL
jgi:L,D-peptidoglycan transpeptidase YkuD (ErfK/YbiS/YcfS/YnhG family)